MVEAGGARPAFVTVGAALGKLDVLAVERAMRQSASSILPLPTCLPSGRDAAGGWNGLVLEGLPIL